MRCLIAIFAMALWSPAHSSGVIENESAAELAVIVQMLDAPAKRVNILEFKSRREHHAYLAESRGETESLDEYLERHAEFARFGQPATDAEIAGLKALSKAAIPPALEAFYREMGSFGGGRGMRNLTIAHPAAFADAHRSDLRPLRSIGLIDVLRSGPWGHLQLFDTASGEGLTPDQVSVLNDRYSVCAWRFVEETEGREYLYFDRAGRFGLLLFHQDHIEDFHSGALLPMVESSPATDSLATALRKLVKGSISDPECGPPPRDSC